MNFKKIAMLTLAAWLIVPAAAQIVVNGDADDSAALKKSAIPKKSETKISPEIQAKLVTFLRETGASAQGLNLPENRVRYTTEAANLLWRHNDKSARELFVAATNDFRTLLQTLDAQQQRRTAGESEGGDEDSLYSMFSGGSAEDFPLSFYAAGNVRRGLLLTLAKRDGALALDFFYETQRPDFQGWNDESFEAQLVAVIAEKDAAQALIIGQKKLAKDDYSGIVELIENLHKKDAAKGAQLASELLGKLGAADFKKNLSASNAAIALLGKITEASGASNVDFGTKKSPEETSAGDKSKTEKPLLNEAETRELAETVAKAIASNVNGEGIYFYRRTGETLKKYAPAAAARLEQKFAADVAAEAQIAKIHEAQMKRQTATAASVENVETPEAKAYAKRQAEREAQTAALGKTMEAAAAPDAKFTIDEAHQALTPIRNRQQRLLAQTGLAKTIAARGDKETALKLLAEVDSAFTPQPRKAAQMIQNLMLADAYAAANPDRAFTILESTIYEFNTVAASAARLGDFIGIKELSSDGEFNMGSLPREFSQAGSLEAGTFSLPKTLSYLAVADIARLTALTDKFDKPEIALEAKMLILRALLPPEIEKPDAEKLETLKVRER